MKSENAHTARLFRSVRESNNWTVRTMATHLSLAPSTVTRIESGHITPNAYAVEKLLRLSGAPDLTTLFKTVFR